MAVPALQTQDTQARDQSLHVHNGLCCLQALFENLTAGNFPHKAQMQPDTDLQCHFPVIFLAQASEDALEPFAGLLPSCDSHFMPSWSLAAELKAISFGNCCKCSIKVLRKD